MPEIRTSEINETAWTGSNIDSKLTNNTTSIKQNCQSLIDAIKKLQSYQGKLRTERPTKIIPLGMTEQEKSMYAPGTRKQEEIYETWEFRGLNNNYVSCAAKIISEIDSLKKLLSDNSIQFTALEASAENLEIEYNKIRAVASAAGIDMGSILLHETDAPTKSGESGDRTLKGEYSGIKEENFYLYENLEEGEYLDLEEGTGVEAGTYFIVKHTKDGRKVKMKNISASTVEDWINKCYKAKQDKDKKTRDNIIKGLAPVGAGIIGLGNKVKGAVNDKVKEMQSAQSAINNAQTETDSATNPDKQREEQRDLKRREDEENNNMSSEPPKTWTDFDGEEYKLTNIRTVDGKSLGTFVDKNGNTYNVTYEKVDNEWKQVGNIKPIKDYGNTFGPKSPQIEKARADGMKRTQTVIEQQANTNKYTHFEGTSISSGTGKTITPVDTSPNNPLTTALDSQKDINVPTGKVEINGEPRIGLGGSTLKYDNENGNWGIDLGNGNLSDERFTKADINSSPQIRNSYNSMSISSDLNPNLNHDLSPNDASIIAQLGSPELSKSEQENLFGQLSPELQNVLKK